MTVTSVVDAAVLTLIICGSWALLSAWMRRR